MHGFAACKAQSWGLVWTSAKCSSFHCEGGLLLRRHACAGPGQDRSQVHKAGGLSLQLLKVRVLEDLTSPWKNFQFLTKQ